MTNTFDETGIVLDSLSEVITGLQAKFKAKFGDNIKVTDKSVFGQFIGIFSEVISDQNDLIQKVVNAYNPNVSTGLMLDNLVGMNGIRRKDSAYSSAVLKCTANDRGCTIPLGSVVSNTETNEKFITDVELVLASNADGTVSATAQTVGAIGAEIGSLTKIETPILGWAEVTNESAAILGADRETDTELRLRRRIASERTGLCSKSALYSALWNLDGVTNVAVYDTENKLSGLPANYVWCVVKGGSDEDIAECIFNNVAGGILTWGDTAVTYSDPITGGDYVINFGRAIDVPLYIIIDITTNKNFPSDGYDLIKANLVNFILGLYIMPDGLTEDGIGIGDSVYFSRLYSPVMAVSGHHINYLYNGATNPPDHEANLNALPNEIFTLAIGDISFV